jgi:heterodisulfide reductase subunit C
MDLQVTKVSTAKKSELVRKIEEWSDQNIFACYQCGKCSAGCPVTEAMDHLPNQIMKLLQMGDEETLLKSNTPWVCASCFTCSSRCPRGVRITEIMEALRLYKLRQNIDHFNPSNLGTELAELPQIAIISCFRKLTS